MQCFPKPHKKIEMPQFRLTAKMARELKITSLEMPSSGHANFYDDWYIDIDRFMRKKVILCMHVDTRAALAIPISEIGGIKNFFPCFKLLLSAVLENIHGYDAYINNVEQYLDIFDAPTNAIAFRACCK